MMTFDSDALREEAKRLQELSKRYRVVFHPVAPYRVQGLTRGELERLAEIERLLLKSFIKE